MAPIPGEESGLEHAPPPHPHTLACTGPSKGAHCLAAPAPRPKERAGAACCPAQPRRCRGAEGVAVPACASLCRRTHGLARAHLRLHFRERAVGSCSEMGGRAGLGSRRASDATHLVGATGPEDAMAAILGTVIRGVLPRLDDDLGMGAIQGARPLDIHILEAARRRPRLQTPKLRFPRPAPPAPSQPAGQTAALCTAVAPASLVCFPLGVFPMALRRPSSALCLVASVVSAWRTDGGARERWASKEWASEQSTHRAFGPAPYIRTPREAVLPWHPKAQLRHAALYELRRVSSSFSARNISFVRNRAPDARISTIISAACKARHDRADFWGLGA